MATTEVTPNVGTGDVSSTPAAVPSTPAVQPTTPETPAAAVPATPVTPKSPVEQLREAAFKLDIPGVEKPKPAEPINAEDAAKPAEVKPAEAADAGKTDEQKAAEAKAAESAKPAVEVNPLDKLGPLPAEKVGEALKSETFVAACKEAGIDTELLMETSRMAAETQMYRDAGLPTPESAAFAVENANHFYDIEENFVKVKDVGSLDSFMTDVMLPLSFLRDAEGKPIPDPQNPGRFKTDGTVERFMAANVDYDHGWTGKIADQLIASADKFKNSDGEYSTDRATEVATYANQLKDAIAFVDEFRKNGYKMPSGEAKPQMSAEDRAEMDRLRARDAEVTEEGRKVQTEKAQIFATQVQTDTLAGIDPLVSDTLNSSSLDDYAKSKVTEDVWKDLTAALQSNRTFQQQKASLYAKGMDEANFKQLVALNTRTAKNLLLGPNGILAKHLTAAGQRRETTQQQRDQKIATQTKTDTMNQGARAAASTNAAANLTSDQIKQKAVETVKAQNGGKLPPDSEGAILREVLKLRAIG